MTLVEPPPSSAPTHTLDHLERATFAATLRGYRHGAGDPTTRLDVIGRGRTAAGHFVRATYTPDGPGTLSIRWAPERPVEVDVWGPGGSWLAERVTDLLGGTDAGAPWLAADAHPVVAAAAGEHRHLRYGRSGTLYHELLPTIIEQRITGGEAVRQWARLCRELSAVAPGPFDALLLPPAPAVLARQPSWWFHPLGIERKRVTPLVEVARHADKLWSWAECAPDEAARRLHLLRGIGAWTTGSVLGPALADPDAVPVGDYHVKNHVAWALAGEPRGTDERMLELLEPYRGQRGRVVWLLGAAGHAAPKFGPRRRVLPMARW